MTTPRHGAHTVRQSPGAGGPTPPPGGVRVLARRYHLIAQLGRGTMGVVWEAYDLAVHRKVAVKEVLLPADMSEHDRAVSRERAQREARAISQLAHPNVIAFYDLVEEDDHPWVVMELVNSRSLADVIRADGPLPLSRIATLALAVLGALEAAHRAGITHRDVKPSNLLLTDDGRIKLTDFGIARTAGDSPITGAGMLVGSPSYIPPEVVQGAAAGPPADMWGLGATLYAAVEARAPFDAGDPMATLHSVVSDPTPNTGRAGPLAPVIDGLLNKDPRRRLDTVKARHLLLDALRAFDRERSNAPAPAPSAPVSAPMPIDPPGGGVGPVNGTTPVNGFLNGSVPLNGSSAPVNGSAVPPVEAPAADPEPDPDFIDPTPAWDRLDLVNDAPVNGAATPVGGQLLAPADDTADHPAMDFAAPPLLPAAIPTPGPTPGPTPSPQPTDPAEEPQESAQPEPPAMDFDAPSYQSPIERATPTPVDFELPTPVSDSGEDHDDDTAVIPKLTENRPAEAEKPAAEEKPAKPKYAHPLAHLEGFDPDAIDSLDGIEDDFGSEPWRTQALRPVGPQNFSWNPSMPPKPVPPQQTGMPQPGMPQPGMPQPGMQEPGMPQRDRRPAPYRDDDGGLAALNLRGDNQGSRTQQMPGFFDEPPRRRPDVDSDRGHSGRTVGIIIAIIVLCIAGYGGYWLVGHFTGDKSKPTGSSSSAPANTASAGQPTSGGAKSTTAKSTAPAAAGYKTYHGQHFSASVPTSWRPDPQSSGVLDFNDPKGDRFVRFVVNVEATGDLVSGFKSAETQFAATHQGYHQIAIKQASYRGYPAADWEFTYDRGSQDVRHVLYRSFTVGSSTYGIYVSAPEAQYQATLPMFNEAAKTFAVRQ